jgi:hypothetical protein
VEYSILGERYLEVKDLGARLWRGDIFLFDESTGPDCRAYMLVSPLGADRLHLVNYIGYKAGNELVATNIPRDAGDEGAFNIRLGWLKDNWNQAIPLGKFETTKFLQWSPRS